MYVCICLVTNWARNFNSLEWEDNLIKYCLKLKFVIQTQTFTITTFTTMYMIFIFALRKMKRMKWRKNFFFQLHSAALHFTFVWFEMTCVIFVFKIWAKKLFRCMFKFIYIFVSSSSLLNLFCLRFCLQSFFSSPSAFAEQKLFNFQCF